MKVDRFQSVDYKRKLELERKAQQKALDDMLPHLGLHKALTHLVIKEKK